MNMSKVELAGIAITITGVPFFALGAYQAAHAVVEEAMSDQAGILRSNSNYDPSSFKDASDRANINLRAGAIMLGAGGVIFGFKRDLWPAIKGVGDSPQTPID